MKGARKWRTRYAYNERRRTCTDGLKWNDDRAGGRLLFVDHAASRTHTLGGRIGHGGWTKLSGRAGGQSARGNRGRREGWAPVKSRRPRYIVASVSSYRRRRPCKQIYIFI